MSDTDMTRGDSWLPEELEKVLREQVIDEDRPGAILRDFRTFLEFIGDGLPAAGKHHLLPMSRLGELNARLSRPVELRLRRPQQRSYPYIQGLYLLFRASGLGRVDGSRAGARLIVDPGTLRSWETLNPVERYLTLLEAWLLHGGTDVLGISGRWGRDLFLQCVHLWQVVPAKGLRVFPDFVYFFSGDPAFHVALMDLFGLMEVEHGRQQEGKPWCPARVRRTAFGEAMMQLLMKHVWLGPLLHEDDAPEEEVEEVEEDLPAEAGQGVAEEHAWDEDLEEDSQDEAGLGGKDDWDEESGGRVGAGLPTRTFGRWQAWFQPYFPQWRSNLVLAEPELREDVFVFKVSLPGVWRRIAVAGGQDLETFANAILRSFRFDRDHLYSFTYRDRFGKEVQVVGPESTDGPCAMDVFVGELPLNAGDRMGFLYDFGDMWRFDVKLERIGPPDRALRKPKQIAGQGKPPPQYPKWEE